MAAAYALWSALTACVAGLAAWARVRDYRQGQIARMANVSVYRDSALTADDVLFSYELFRD